MSLLIGQSVREALRQRSAILDLNTTQRNGTHGVGNQHAFGRKGSTQTWGRSFLRVPVSDLRQLEARNPALRSKDPKEFSAAWLEFERSDESLPYRTSEDYSGPSKPLFFGSR